MTRHLRRRAARTGPIVHADPSDTPFGRVRRVITWRIPDRTTSLDVVAQLVALSVVGAGCWMALDTGLGRTAELIVSTPTLWMLLRFGLVVLRWTPTVEGQVGR